MFWIKGKDKKIIKAINTGCAQAKDLLKDGGVFFICAIPNMTVEQFEKWQLGEPIKLANGMCGDCTPKELTVLLNILAEARDKLTSEHPEVLMAEMLSQFKHSMVIDEEDLKK